MRGILLAIALFFLTYSAYYLFNYSNWPRRQAAPKIHSALTPEKDRTKLQVDSKLPSDSAASVATVPLMKAEEPSAFPTKTSPPERLLKRIDDQATSAIEESLIYLAKLAKTPDHPSGDRDVIDQALIQSYGEGLSDQLESYLREGVSPPPLMGEALRLVIKEGGVRAVNLLQERLRQSEQIRGLFYQQVNQETSTPFSRMLAEALLTTLLEILQSKEELDAQAMTALKKSLTALDDEGAAQAWVRSQLAREGELAPPLRSAMQELLPKESSEKTVEPAE